MRKDGADKLQVESRPEESLWVVRTVEDLVPGWPPKSNRSMVLNADNVCQASVGEEAVAKSCHGGEEALKEVERSRTNRSDIAGAEAYE